MKSNPSPNPFSLNLNYRERSGKKTFLRLSIYTVAFLILVSIFLHIPFYNVESDEILFQYYYDLQKQTLINELEGAPVAQNKRKIKPFVFHVEQDKDVYGVFFIDERGSIQKNFVISNKNGYLTYADNPTFFIWYPKYGSKIKLYDANGNFLWEGRESRYLKVLPNEKFIVAFSGDESRVEFLKPDMTGVLSIEGFLRLSEHINLNKSAETEADGCIAFLNGDIVFPDFSKRINRRFSLKKPLKSLKCNFKEKYLFAQVEKETKLVAEKNHLTDVLIKIDMSEIFTIGEDKKGTLDTEFLIQEFILPQKYPFSLPLGWLNEDLVVILPVYGDAAVSLTAEIWLWEEPDAKPKRYIWPERFSQIQDFGTFRIQQGDDFLLISTRSLLWVLTPQGAVYQRRFDEIVRTAYQKSSIYVQTRAGLFSFKLKRDRVNKVFDFM